MAGARRALCIELAVLGGLLSCRAPVVEGEGAGEAGFGVSAFRGPGRPPGAWLSGGDTGDPNIADSGFDTGRAEEVLEGVYEDGRRWLAVRLAGDPVTVVVVVHPASAEATRYEEGAPVVVAAWGGLGAGDCEDPPRPVMSRDGGVVTVQVMGPADCCQALCGEGEDDFGGAGYRTAVVQAFRFAGGNGLTVGGRALSELLEIPLLQDLPVALLSSGATIPALGALRREPASFASLAGVVTYEPPVYPAALAATLGLTAMDPDASADGDGDGLAWDDGRNPHYRMGDCGRRNCALELGSLAWDPEMSLDGIRGAVGEGDLSIPGVLFLDGNGNGVLDLVEGSPDVDGDGWIGPEEDFPLVGSIQERSDGTVAWHPQAVLLAAGQAGLWSAGEWPHHIATPEDGQAFWPERNGIVQVKEAVKPFATIPWWVVAGWTDHGVAQPTRPHVVGIHRALSQSGVSVRFNPSSDALEELGATVGDDYRPLEAGEVLTEVNVRDHLPPVEVSGSLVRQAGVLQLLDEIHAD